MISFNSSVLIKRLNCPHLSSLSKKWLNQVSSFVLIKSLICPHLSSLSTTKPFSFSPPYKGANEDVECSTFWAEISGGRS